MISSFFFLIFLFAPLVSRQGKYNNRENKNIIKILFASVSRNPVLVCFFSSNKELFLVKK